MRRQLRSGPGRQGLLPGNGVAQRLFLRSPIKLPEPQGCRQRRRRNGRSRDQYKPPEVWNSGRSHQIIHFMKFIIILAFLAILASLGSALFFMMRQGGDHDSEADDALRRRKMFRALAWRVALSITLFVCILLAAKLGYIQPTGWQPGQ